MRQATIQLKTRIQNANITNNNIEVRKIVLNGMLAILAALMIWYVIILANTVGNILERKSLEKETAALSSEVGNLELSYLAVSNSVDLALSSSMGYKETHINFATRRPLGSLKLANNEI